ncbi:MAG: ABC transporter permease [Planctomycetota bacterium]
MADPTIPPAQAPADAGKTAYYEASHWTLMRRRFCKHRVAFWCTHLVFLIYALCLAAPLLAPYDPVKIHSNFINLPPQIVHVGFVENHTLPRLYVHPYRQNMDPSTLDRTYWVDESVRVPIRFFVEGHSWGLFGLESNRHLFGVDEGQTCFLFGTGQLGQDSLSRMLYGGRVSLLLGLMGVLLSFFLGLTLGGISGYYGGRIDMIIQRSAEVMMTIPSIPLWLALGAAIPKDWSPLQVYWGMTMILACIGWTGMCRTVRGKLLSLREEDYAKAALLAGATEGRIIAVHLIPNFFSHIIASLSLAVPGMILAETSLSFLGLGLRPPVVSWGVLLQEATVDSVINQPWLLMPAACVILIVLSFNFMGEGMRDAADPYA